MSTDNAGTSATRPTLSREGDVIEPNPANLEQRQRIDDTYTTTSRPHHDEKTPSSSKGSTTTSAVHSGVGDKGGTSEGGGGQAGPAAALSALDEGPPRQVIAVSASKSPAAFFNLARKFLVSNEMCDLSALEGAIVSAVDAAHLLERSKLATIVRIQTSYVSVEPKRKKQVPQQQQQEDESSLSVQPASSSESTREDANVTRAGGVGGEDETEPETDSGKTTPEKIPPRSTQPESGQSSTSTSPPTATSTPPTAKYTTSGQQRTGSRSSSTGGGGRELRRARIVITVRRTENYKRWLEENPLQAMIASEGETATEDVEAAVQQQEVTNPIKSA